MHLKDNESEIGIDRKTAKRLYLYMFNPRVARNQSEKRQIERMKSLHTQTFDNEWWPTECD